MADRIPEWSGPAGVMESRITLALARQLKSALETEFQAEVFLTREEGENPDLTRRTALANDLQADLFLSIHLNGSTATGTFRA